MRQLARFTQRPDCTVSGDERSSKLLWAATDGSSGAHYVIWGE